MARPFFTAMILLLLVLPAVQSFGQNLTEIPLVPAAGQYLQENQQLPADGQNAQEGLSVPADDLDSIHSDIAVTPLEIDLGVLGPGEEAEKTFYLNNKGPGNTEWFAEGPGGWKLSEGQNISGLIGRTPEPLRIRLSYVREVGASKNRGCSLVLRLEARDVAATLRREAPFGELWEEILFLYDGGTASLFFHARLIEMAPEPLLDAEPLRMDFGTIRSGEQVTKKILLRNRGRESLKWKAGVAGGRGMPSKALPLVGRYISFRNEDAGAGSHSFNGPLPEGVELSGNWAEAGGYPAAQGEQSVFRYRFTGTGINIFFLKSPDGGPFSVFFDEQFVTTIDGLAERRERWEAIIVEGQIDGQHLLTIVNGKERLTLEGVRVIGKPIQKGPRGWISVFPDSGFTSRETDYINVTLNTRDLVPGVYGDHVLFLSNGGGADVEVFAEIAADTAPQFLAVHRYLAGSDYLYTTNPKAEAQRMQPRGYRNTGIAFRLFAPGTPGTTDFFRWFNPSKGDHYYSYDPKGGKPLTGYLLEGAIGNIATSRLSGTRELYRWFNPATGRHFYTTDQAGEGISKKGYRFDGIAGFVR